MLRDILFVAGGSALGGVLRLLTVRLVRAWLQPASTWPTFPVNLVGGFAIGWITAWSTRHPSCVPAVLSLPSADHSARLTPFSLCA